MCMPDKIYIIKTKEMKFEYIERRCKEYIQNILMVQKYSGKKILNFKICAKIFKLLLLQSKISICINNRSQSETHSMTYIFNL